MVQLKRHVICVSCVTILIGLSACKTSNSSNKLAYERVSAAPSNKEMLLFDSERCYEVKSHKGTIDHWLSNAESICIKQPTDSKNDSLHSITFHGSFRILNTYKSERLKLGEEKCPGCAVFASPLELIRLIPNRDASKSPTQYGVSFSSVEPGQTHDFGVELIKSQKLPLKKN